MDTHFEYVIWTPAECAEYLKCSVGTFNRETRYQDEFPSPLKMSAKGRARWRAKDVVEWALRS